MILWVLFALMTAVLVWVVLRPFHVTRRDPGDMAGQDGLSIYKSQIAEIDNDVDRGVLTVSDADVLRTEIGRRLLSRSEHETVGSGDSSEPHTASAFRGVTGAVVAVVPTLALTVYLMTGSPLLPSRPFAERLQQGATGNSLANLVRRVEQQLLKHPDDGRGWDVIAPVYVKTGRYADGADAYRRAARMLGETPTRVFGFAEARVYADNGIVSERSRKAFERGLELEPDRPTAKFWLAIAKKQDGNLTEAREDLTALLEKINPETPFGRAVANNIDAIDRKLRGGDKPLASNANSTQPNSDTAAMINGMVSRLAKRLEEDANDLKGWKRLIRSYVVLQRKNDAVTALRRARDVFSSKPGYLDQLRVLATELKLGT